MNENKNIKRSAKKKTKSDKLKTMFKKKLHTKIRKQKIQHIASAIEHEKKVSLFGKKYLTEVLNIRFSCFSYFEH